MKPTSLVSAIAILIATCALTLPLLSAPAPATAPSAQYPDLLSTKYTPADLRRVLVPHEKWVPFPALADRAGWAKAEKETLDACIKFAEKHLDYKWPVVPATLSLAFVRNGNRSHYDNQSAQKRGILAALLLAEIAENKGRFIDPIINGVWSICEESWWGSSAHLPKNHEHSGLADVTAPIVDLFSATTAETLAWTDYFLGKKFDAISPQIRKRISYEIQRRILYPALNKHHSWMGKKRGGNAPNNWNPWICSNWLACALLIEKDETLRARHLEAILSTLDNYTNHYPQDGGCDEGPGYWNAAPGSLFDNLALLNSATKNAFQYAFRDDKIKNMGKFIYRTQISERYMVNFADAGPRAGVDGPMAYRFAKAIGDANMAAFAANYQVQPRARADRAVHFARVLSELFVLKEFRKAPAAAPLPADVWLPDLQVATARDKAGSTKGFYFAAKGGNNAESHNHNDIGNIIVFYDGNPVLIDIGAGRYTAKTFSAKRYEIWNMRSAYHNTPTINGVLQSAGGKFKAFSTKHSATASTAIFSLDIAKAYPPAAAVKKWLRTITLNRGNKIAIKDEVDLEKTESIVEHFMTCHPVEITRNGEVIILVNAKAENAKTNKTGSKTESKEENKKVIPMRLKFSETGTGMGMSAGASVGTRAKVEVVVEKVKLAGETDDGIRRNWGDNINRISFKISAPKPHGVYVLEIEKNKK
jgi:hypothetical protein